MKEQTILLVEDNFLNRRLIKKILTEQGYHILESQNSGEALEILENNSVNLAILDINLGEDEMNGIHLGQFIKDKYDIPFIYLTAYETPEIINQAIVTKPCSYITKPFKQIDLIISVEIALQQTSGKDLKSEEQTNYIVVKDGDYNIRILFTDIDYIESEGNYLLIFSNNEVYRYRSTLKQVLDILPDHIFVQTHRAFVINKNKIQKYSSKEVILEKISIPVSKKYVDNLIIWK